MFRNRKHALVALAVMIAFVAVVVPTCRMVGCSMDMSAMQEMGDHMGMAMGAGLATVSDACDGLMLYSITPDALAPSGIESLLMAIAVALFGALVLMRPQMVSRPVFVRQASPPPPPEDPLGVRFTV